MDTVAIFGLIENVCTQVVAFLQTWGEVLLAAKGWCRRVVGQTYPNSYRVMSFVPPAAVFIDILLLVKWWTLTNGGYFFQLFVDPRVCYDILTLLW